MASITAEQVKSGMKITVNHWCGKLTATVIEIGQRPVVKGMLAAGVMLQTNMGPIALNAGETVSLDD